MPRFRLSGGLDDWIRRRGITHPLIVPVLRNQILLLLLALFVASGFAADSLWGMWFCTGFAIMSYVLWSWAGFFSGNPFHSYSSAFLRAVIFRFAFRLVLIAFVFYASFTWGKADPLALLAGIASGTLAPVLTTVWERGSKR